MTISIILLLIIILITTVIIYNSIHKHKTKISFKESMDLTELPVITFINNGKKLNFLLDTGSNESYINSSILKELDYKMLNKTTETLIADGTKTDTKKCSMSIYYKNNSFETNFCIFDMDSAFSTIKSESGVQIHGILGSLFFQKYKYVLDFSSLIAYLK